MSKELEALKQIEDWFVDYLDYHGFKHQECPNTRIHVRKDFGIELIEKALKALEIIKEKRVDVSYLIICIEQNVKPLQFYNEMAKDLHNGELTQEEYDLLREVLL